MSDLVEISEKINESQAKNHVEYFALLTLPKDKVYPEIKGLMLRSEIAFIEHFNRSYRNEVLDTWMFRSLTEIRQLTWAWVLEYYEERDHDNLGGLTLAEVLGNARVSTYALSI